MSDLALLIQSCGFIIPVVIVLAYFFWGILKLVQRQNRKLGNELVVILSYLFCVGVVLHEAAHQAFCFVFGVRVQEVRFFFVERFKPNIRPH